MYAKELNVVFFETFSASGDGSACAAAAATEPRNLAVAPDICEGCEGPPKAILSSPSLG